MWKKSMIISLAVVFSGAFSAVGVTPAQAYLKCTVTARSPYEDGILTHHMNATGKMVCGQNYSRIQITVTLKYYYPVTKTWLLAKQQTFNKPSANTIDNSVNPVQFVCVNDTTVPPWTWRTHVEGSAFSQDGVRRWHGSDTTDLAVACIA